MKRISCIFGRHWYIPSKIELYLVEKKPHSNVYRSIARCMYCGKENEQLIEIPHWGAREERRMDDFRQAAIDALTDFYYHVGFYDKMTVAKCLAIVNELPSVEQQRWIPVTERLPDKMGTYLVTLDYKEHGTGVMSLWFHNEEIGWDLRVADEVTAWMPMPEPYCGEEMQSTMGQINDDAQSTKGGDSSCT